MMRLDPQYQLLADFAAMIAEELARLLQKLRNAEPLTCEEQAGLGLHVQSLQFLRPFLMEHEEPTEEDRAWFEDLLSDIGPLDTDVPPEGDEDD